MTSYFKLLIDLTEVKHLARSFNHRSTFLCNRLLLKLLNELHPVFEEGRYAGLGSPCTTEKQEICPFEIRTVMAVPFSQLRGFCSPFLALLKVLNPHLLLLCSAQLCPAVSVLALAQQQCGTICRGCNAGVSSLPVLRGVDQKRCCGLCDDFLCLCWTVPFCCNFSTKYSVAWACDFALAVS